MAIDDIIADYRAGKITREEYYAQLAESSRGTGNSQASQGYGSLSSGQGFKRMVEYDAAGNRTVQQESSGTSASVAAAGNVNIFASA